MTRDTISFAFVVVVAILMGASHLAAGRDPYKNFVTQLVFTWYDAHSPYEGEGLRRLLKFCGVLYYAMAVVFVLVRAYQIFY